MKSIKNKINQRAEIMHMTPQGSEIELQLRCSLWRPVDSMVGMVLLSIVRFSPLFETPLFRTFPNE